MQAIPCPSQPLNDTPWTPIAKARLITGTPQTSYKTLHSSADERFTAGIWECTPGKWRTHYETEEEFCTLIEGCVRLTPENGSAQDFRAPDSFIIPCGFKGTWEAVTKVRKYFVIYDKAAA